MSEMTHAGLYDLLQTYFGIGDYVDDEREPWYKARMNEIGKLKRFMNSRHVDVATMAQAAEYAHDRHLPVTATWQLVELVPEARRAAREALRERSLSERLQDAVSQAVAAGETEWAQRLAGASSQEVLEAWEDSRG